MADESFKTFAELGRSGDGDHHLCDAGEPSQGGGKAGAQQAKQARTLASRGRLQASREWCVEQHRVVLRGETAQCTARPISGQIERGRAVGVDALPVREIGGVSLGFGGCLQVPSKLQEPGSRFGQRGLSAHSRAIAVGEFFEKTGHRPTVAEHAVGLQNQCMIVGRELDQRGAEPPQADLI